MPVVVDAGLPAGSRGLFTTRSGGVSGAPYGEANLGDHVGDADGAVTANRRALAGLLGGPPIAFVRQVHGAAVHVVTERPDGVATLDVAADAVVTSRADVAVAVVVADCVPVLLADPEAEVVAAVHAGRPGLAAGVLPATIAAMVGLGARPGSTTAVIGPSICAACYEVPEQLRAEVAARVPGSAATSRLGTPALDLAAGARVAMAGLAIGRVVQLPGCVAEDTRFFSYRRDGVTGRTAGAVMLTR